MRLSEDSSRIDKRDTSAMEGSSSVDFNKQADELYNSTITGSLLTKLNSGEGQIGVEYLSLT
jgi:hypothetical protein